MKRTFKLIQIFLLILGVIGVDAEKVKSVSVMEGDSVTLNSDLNQTQEIILILWRFGDKGSAIAQIDGKEISYPRHTEIFRGRLQLDHQTGSLTIMNMKTKHSGLYKLQMDLKSGTSRITFNVAVSESPSVISGGEAEMKSVSVKEGDSVTLQTDVTETQGDELIVWRFGDERKLIAKCDIETNNSTLYETDERFRDRLKLDHQTGSLTITNTRNTDSGLYIVKISSNKQTIYKRFTVTVSALPDPGLSSGAVAGIVLLVLLLVSAVAVAGVIYYHRKISDLEKQKRAVVVPVSVSEGDDVTLNTGVPGTQRDDVTLNTGVPGTQRDDLIEWRFRGSLIAEIKGETSKVYDNVLAGRFRNRLKVDQKTGSLTIRNTEMKHAGVYELKIKSGREVSYKKFIIIPEARIIPMEEGESVTLHTKTEIQRDDQLVWMFGESLLAQIKDGNRETSDGPDEIFKDSLELDEKTGSLTIKNMKSEQSGLYKLEIRSSRGNTDKRFFVTFYGRKPCSASHQSTPPQKAEHRESKSMILEKQVNEEIPDKVNESVNVEIPQSNEEIHDGGNEKMELLSDVNDHQEASSL